VKGIRVPFNDQSVNDVREIIYVQLETRGDKIIYYVAADGP
jgi:hypothetical protein